MTKKKQHTSKSYMIFLIINFKMLVYY